MCTLTQTPFCKRSNVMDLACMISDYTPPTSLEAPSNSYFSIAVPAPSSYVRSPQAPLSPPVEDQRRCSLPSISSLLEAADDLPAAKRHRPNRGRSSRGHSLSQDISPPSPARVPPTPPPQRPDSRFHDRRESYPHSPSASVSRGSVSSTTTSASAPSYDLYVHPHHQSRILSSPSSTTAPSGPSPPYASPALSTASYASPVDSSASGSMCFYQAAQPKQPPTTTTTSIPPAPAVVPVTTPAWPQQQQQQQQQQHHHYFPPSTAAPYQQPQDRYICRVCNKAFSRPSSLRIHSHSHTGEKPFRCTHAGCGKSFSVRSNMKRHERGCHPARSLV